MDNEQELLEAANKVKLHCQSANCSKCIFCQPEHDICRLIFDSQSKLVYPGEWPIEDKKLFVRF